MTHQRIELASGALVALNCPARARLRLSWWIRLWLRRLVVAGSGSEPRRERAHPDRSPLVLGGLADLGAVSVAGRSGHHGFIDHSRGDGRPRARFHPRRILMVGHMSGGMDTACQRAGFGWFCRDIAEGYIPAYRAVRI